MVRAILAGQGNFPKAAKMGSITAHKIEYNGAWALLKMSVLQYFFSQQ